MSSIIDSTDLSDYLDKDKLVDAQAEAAVQAVNAWIETTTSRRWGETVQVEEEYDYKRVIWLRHPDVKSVQEVRLGLPNRAQTVLSEQAYYFTKLGRLNLLTDFSRLDPTSPSLHDYVTVVYTYGVEDVPGDLKTAALGIAAGFYNWAVNEQKDIVAAQVGSYQLQYAGARRGTSPDDVTTSTQAANFAIISSYKVRRI